MSQEQSAPRICGCGRTLKPGEFPCPAGTRTASTEPLDITPIGSGLGCMDCGVLYEQFPLDTMLPDEQWLMIHTSSGGVLCASCIVRRVAKLPGAIAIRARIEFVEPLQ